MAALRARTHELAHLARTRAIVPSQMISSIDSSILLKHHGHEYNTIQINAIYHTIISLLSVSLLAKLAQCTFQATSGGGIMQLKSLIIFIDPTLEYRFNLLRSEAYAWPASLAWLALLASAPQP